MPHTADTALAWVKTKINKAATDKLRGYAVLDLVSFMGVIGSHSDDEWYKSYALLQYYNGGVSVRKIWNPTPGSAAWKDPAPKTPKR
jgi:hypothetical protein